MLIPFNLNPIILPVALLHSATPRVLCFVEVCEWVKGANRFEFGPGRGCDWRNEAHHDFKGGELNFGCAFEGVPLCSILMMAELMRGSN